MRRVSGGTPKAVPPFRCMTIRRIALRASALRSWIPPRNIQVRAGGTHPWFRPTALRTRRGPGDPGASSGHDALGQDQFHRVHHLAARYHQGVEARDHGPLDQPLEVEFVLHLRLVLEEMDQYQALIRRRDVGHTEGIGGISEGDALEINVRLRKLGQDVVHVVIHAAIMVSMTSAGW